MICIILVLFHFQGLVLIRVFFVTILYPRAQCYFEIVELSKVFFFFSLFAYKSSKHMHNLLVKAGHLTKTTTTQDEISQKGRNSTKILTNNTCWSPYLWKIWVAYSFKSRKSVSSALLHKPVFLLFFFFFSFPNQQDVTYHTV